MKDEHIERLIDALEFHSKGVNKIGDALKSLAFYVWLPIYLALLALVGVACVYLLFWTNI